MSRPICFVAFCLVLTVGFISPGLKAAEDSEKAKLDYRDVDTNEILRLVLVDWMTEHKAEAYGYLIDRDEEGKRQEKPTLKRLLIDERYVPQGFKLEIPGVKVEMFDRSRQELKSGEMCIRILRFERKAAGEFEIEFLHSGYTIIGGDFVTYSAKQVDNKWSVEFKLAFDP